MEFVMQFPLQSDLTPIRDRVMHDAVSAAVECQAVKSQSGISFTIEAVPEGLFVTATGFVAAVTAYGELDGTVYEFPGELIGHFSGRRVIVDRCYIDTTSLDD